MHARQRPTAEKILDAVMGAGRIAIVTHQRADGDALGAAAGLRELLVSQGRTASTIVFERPSPKYAFVADRTPLLIWGSDAARAAWEGADLWIMVDTAARQQVEPIAPWITRPPAQRPKLIVIDHHRTGDVQGDFHLADDSAAAASLLIAEWATIVAWPLPRLAAELLFIGLSTDTGWFRHSNADARAFAIAAQLIESGANATDLYRLLFQTDPLARLRLFAAAMSAMTVEADGRLAVMEVTRELMSRCGATPGMTEDLVNEPFRVGQIVASVMLIEQDDGAIRANLRSKDATDVSAIAQQFGGGGHTQAAGARLPGPMAAARERIIRAVTAAMTNGGSPAPG